MPYVSRFQIRRVVLYFKRRGIVPFRGFDNPDAGLDEKEMGMIKDILALDCTLYLDEIALKLWGLTNVYRSESRVADLQGAVEDGAHIESGNALSM